MLAGAGTYTFITERETLFEKALYIYIKIKMKNSHTSELFCCVWRIKDKLKLLIIFNSFSI